MLLTKVLGQVPFDLCIQISAPCVDHKEVDWHKMISENFGKFFFCIIKRKTRISNQASNNNNYA